MFVCLAAALWGSSNQPLLKADLQWKLFCWFRYVTPLEFTSSASSARCPPCPGHLSALQVLVKPLCALPARTCAHGGAGAATRHHRCVTSACAHTTAGNKYEMGMDCAMKPCSHLHRMGCSSGCPGAFCSPGHVPEALT